jgi:hypothetical protein
MAEGEEGDLEKQDRIDTLRYVCELYPCCLSLFHVGSLGTCSTTWGAGRAASCRYPMCFVFDSYLLAIFASHCMDNFVRRERAREEH